MSRTRNRTRLFPLLLSLAFASAAAAQTNGGWPKLQPFTDEDILEGRIAGTDWGFGPAFDNSQLNDPTVPVVVKAINMMSGDPTTKFIGLVKIQGAEIENRGAKATRSVQLRWALVRRGEPDKVLAEGTTPSFDLQLGPGASLKTDTPPVFFNRIVKPFLEDGQLHGKFSIVVGVGEVVFDDGSVWPRLD
jgi:hypothetical protein